MLDFLGLTKCGNDIVFTKRYAAVNLRAREIQIYSSGRLAAKIDGGQPYRPVKAANAEFNRTTRRFIGTRAPNL